MADENIALSLFDDNVSYAEKRKMAKRVLELGLDGNKNGNSLKRISLKEKDLPSFVTKKLCDFIKCNTIKFFDRFNISTSFLINDPSEWNDSGEFKDALEIIGKLKVVNDSAERGVKLMQDYNQKLTKKSMNFKIYYKL